jgi:hypothetical protein
LFFSFGYKVAIKGLQAASTIPFPIPISRVPENNIQKSLAKRVKTIPPKCVIKAMFIIFFIPKRSTKKPPMIIDKVNP